jgi:MoaA/NifB/PqqE/SkfB family radical SAM enzyme
MIEILPYIPLYQAFRRFGWPQLLPINLTLTPSPRCNSRCLTCNIWKKREDDLRLEEWSKIFQSLGKAPFWVTISGGEPFLNPQIVELAQLLVQHCRPGIINIPHNGLLPRVAPKLVAAIAESCPDTQIIINLSLDGVGEQHDHIRGVPGNFEKFERTLQALSELDYPNLAIGIHTVISKLNVHDIDRVFDYALDLAPDSYITEIAEERIELDTVGLDITPSAEEYRQAIDNLISRLSARSFGGISQVTKAFRLEYYRLVKRILVERTQIIPCFAGWASAQIYANGDVWPCCVRADTMLNLRDIDYDFKQAWFSPEADRIRRSIYNKECHCPLANASYTNLLCHYPSLARISTTLVRNRLQRQKPMVSVSEAAR